MATHTVYNPHLCTEMIEAGAQGQSIYAFRGEKLISLAQWTEWLEDDNLPEFKEALDLANCALFNYYETILREGLGEGGFEGTGLSTKERCALARDRLNHIDAQNLKVNGFSPTAHHTERETHWVEDPRAYDKSVKSMDAAEEFD